MLFLVLVLLGGPVHAARMLPAVTFAGPAGLNVTFDPDVWTLRWGCGGPVRVTSCAAAWSDPGPAGRSRRRRVIRAPPGCECRFPPLTLHRGVTLEVNTTDAHARLRYVNAGAEGSEARNVTCEIRAAREFACAWAPGSGAPRDARYELLVKDHAGEVVTPCPAPPADPTHCRTVDLSRLPDHAYVLVTGRSRHARIRFYDATLNAKLIEVLSPPGNVSLTCNETHCVATWARPATWAPMTPSDFRYDVHVRRGDLGDEDGSGFTVRISSAPDTRLVFPSPAPRPRLGVRVRAGDVRSERWSEWSLRVEPVDGGDPAAGAAVPGAHGLHVFLAAAAASLLCALCVGLACRRTYRLLALFPPVPRIRDRVTDNDRVNPQTLRKELTP